jgi:hypothetical protein
MSGMAYPWGRAGVPLIFSVGAGRSRGRRPGAQPQHGLRQPPPSVKRATPHFIQDTSARAIHNDQASMASR